jgi:hypothetical protein
MGLSFGKTWTSIGCRSQQVIDEELSQMLLANQNRPMIDVFWAHIAVDGDETLDLRFPTPGASAIATTARQSLGGNERDAVQTSSDSA